MNFSENDCTVLDLAVYTEKYIYNLYYHSKNNPYEDWHFPLQVVTKAKQLLDTVISETSCHYIAHLTEDILLTIEQLIKQWEYLPILEWDTKQGRTNLKIGWKKKELAKIKAREQTLDKWVSVLKDRLIYDVQIMMAYKIGLCGPEFEPDVSKL